jgi:folate-binding protein YgfZ
VADIVSQYHSIGRGAGWLQPSPRGRLRFDGPDAATFLQALVSNDVLALEPGQGAYATYLTPQGRMLADLEVHRRPDSLLCLVPRGRGAELAARFDQLVFSEDVKVTDVSDELTELLIVGAAAAEVVARAFGVDFETLVGLRELAHVTADDAIVVRTGEARLPVFRLIVPAGQREEAVARLEETGAPVISLELVEALRIEAGRPLWGVDLTPETIPLEAGLLDRAISTTKGCYVGQEIIIRVLHRGGGRVAKRLVTLAFDAASSSMPVAGAPLTTADGAEAGRLTSVSIAPDGSRAIALGYVGREQAVDGTELILTGTPQHAVVTGLAG